MIVRRVDSFAASSKRRLVQHPRFFFFDNGVLNGLLNNFSVSDDRKGQLFENLFVTQLIYSLSYSEHEYRISTYRTDAGAEVDLILELNGEVFAIEVKSGSFSKAELRGLGSFSAYYGKKCRLVVVVPHETHRIMDGIEVMSWVEFLSRI
jgi:hypothetical protein